MTLMMKILNQENEPFLKIKKNQGDSEEDNISLTHITNETSRSTKRPINRSNMARQSSNNNLSNRSDIDLKENVANNNSNNNSTNQSNENDNIYEECLSLIGFGKFQILLVIVCGMANASDAIEILCVSFVLPTAQCELNMSSSDKGILSSMTFLGMMFGGYIWGTLGDVLGRKRILISALLFNALFAILCGISQSFYSLMIFRFLSGIGVGGSIPLVWSYFIEFIPKDIRGRLMSCLAASWFFGNLLVILFAYLTLNKPQIDIRFLSIYINDWRLFMILCGLPSIATAILLIFMPESPKFCLHSGQHMETKRILRSIYNFNKKSRSISDIDAKKLAFDKIDTIKPSTLSKIDLSDEDDTDRLIGSGPTGSRFNYYIFYTKHHTVEILKKTLEIFKKPHTLKTFLLLLIGFSTCFGYYGLWMWLPELYHKMSINGGSPCSSGSITNTTTNQTVNCVLDPNIYRSTFISAMSNLPGNLFTIIFIDKMGRNLVTSLSLIASGLSVFGIPFIHSENEGVILATIFGGINVITFNSFGCTSTEVYPTKLRSTSQGVLYVAGRLGAIGGNLIFGLAVDVSCYIPLLSISLLLILSGLISFKLPESNRINMD